MALGKIEKLGAGGVSSGLLAIIAYFKIGGDLKELLMTIVPATITGALFLFEYLRVLLGWSSFSEASAKRAYKMYHEKVDDQIKRCEKDLKNTNLLAEHKKELQTELFMLMRSRQRAPEITPTSEAPTRRTQT
ncbi:MULTISPECIES: hypothetical protein [Alteromonas]|jgi:hypothetical protein|uniref:Uncharacterized protein n=1 Tax=Alteromonas macleodii TaxID=28108 RepID=A0A6T9Y1R2_ALTMA|nr:MULTISPECIES: hypothetical protein [Alteromonas]OLF71153.1 hypothetical protein AWH61_19070 [Alteromonas sp. W12]CAB9494099.1 protein of unknown function [Alteromonas macleodii]